jgi:hypothetical protein
METRMISALEHTAQVSGMLIRMRPGDCAVKEEINVVVLRKERKEERKG